MADTIRAELLKRWAALATRERWADDAGPAVCHDLLVNCYGDRRRAYHNEQHLLECLTQLDATGRLADDPAAVEIALWFHDAIYDPTRTDNEAASADLAAAQLSQLGEPADRIALVRDLILATAHRHDPAAPDARLIVDIDLSILGMPEEHFDAYDLAIRIEYAHVPEAAYRHGRAAVLRGFLERPTIYRLPEFITRYESRARANLTRAIATLR